MRYCVRKREPQLHYFRIIAQDGFKKNIINFVLILTGLREEAKPIEFIQQFTPNV